MMQALRLAKSGLSDISSATSVLEKRKMLWSHIVTIRYEKSIGDPWGPFPKPKSFFEKLQKVCADFTERDEFDSNQNQELNSIHCLIQELIAKRSVPYPCYTFSEGEVDQLLERLMAAYAAFGGNIADFSLEQDSSIPTKFASSTILEAITAASELANATTHVETMILRVKALLNDAKLKKVMFDVDVPSFETWFSSLLGETSEYSVTILDLSLLPSSVIHTITAVLSRLVFEALQRYRKMSESNAALPVVLVMEEAAW